MAFCVAVVDDQQPVRKALERLLRSSGYAVRCFDTAAAFLESLHDYEPSCVLLDLHMPPPNGFDVLESLHRAGKALSVVVISADFSRQNRDRVMTAGAQAFLSKPVDEALLLYEVNAAVRAQAERRLGA